MPKQPAFLPAMPVPRVSNTVARNSHLEKQRPHIPVATIAKPRSLAPRTDFPILFRSVNDSPLVYLDSAATSQKPQKVLDTLREYYESYNSNVHRGDHFLAAAATDAVERSRELIASFVNALDRDEIIFTRNATESINLVAKSWSSKNLKEGDKIVVSVMEHHANLVPWQMAAAEAGAKVVPIPLSDEEGYNVEALREELAKGGVKVVACSHVSNVLGCFNPVAEIARIAHDAGAIVVVDACQSVPNMPVDVQTLDCDFLVASSHKMCGPTGVGFLWGRRSLLEDMPPYMGGGEMIADVFLDRSTFAGLPHKFEAGTKAIGEIVALGAAVEYLNELGMEEVHRYEQELGAYLYGKLSQFQELNVYGPPPPRAGLCAFNVDGVHASDLATMLDLEGIAVRSGHHCAQPLHRQLGVSSSARASMYVYNTTDEIDVFIEALKASVELLGGKLTVRS